MGGILGATARPCGGPWFQVVPPHGGISLMYGLFRFSFVSSRAPAWGASHVHVTEPISAFVSSRAPAWGASRGSVVRCTVPAVSSRAPAWGASALGYYQQRAALSFKSCPRMGGIRHLLSTQGAASIRFQVVPPHGGHRWGSAGYDPGCCVSSRAPAWGASGAERAMA